jgi:hypothetical protein
VANQQGKYLARALNSGAAEPPPFVYRHLGSMAQVGSFRVRLSDHGTPIGTAPDCAKELWSSYMLFAMGTRVRAHLHTAGSEGLAAVANAADHVLPACSWMVCVMNCLSPARCAAVALIYAMI